MAKTVKRHGLTLADKLYLPAIFGGMRTTFSHFIKNFLDNSKLKTLSYPEAQPTDVGERYRGMHRLTKREDDSIRCVACFMCSTACPADCIDIEAIEREDGVDEKMPLSFSIDLLECVYCGYCVEACPCDAIRMDTGIFSTTGNRREVFVIHKDELLANKRCKDYKDE